MEKTVKSKELTIDMTGKRENEIPENTTIEFETKPDDPPDIASLKITDSDGHVKIKHGDTIKDKISVKYDKQKKGYTFPTKFQNKKYKIYVDDTYSSSEKKVNFEIQTNNNQLVGEIKLTNIGTTAADTNTAASGADTNTAGAATNTAAPVVSATQAPVAASQAPTPVAGATLGATKVAEMLKEIKIGQFTIEGFDNNNIVINDDTLDNLFKIKDGNVTIDNNKVNEFFTTAEDNLEVSVIKKNAQGGFDGIQKMNFGILKTIQGINITTINDLKDPIMLSPDQLSKIPSGEQVTNLDATQSEANTNAEPDKQALEDKIEDVFKNFDQFGDITDSAFKKEKFEAEFVTPILKEPPIDLMKNVKTAIGKLVAALETGPENEANKITPNELVELKAALTTLKDNNNLPDFIKNPTGDVETYLELAKQKKNEYKRDKKIENVIAAKKLEEELRLFLYDNKDDDVKITNAMNEIFTQIKNNKENNKNFYKTIIGDLLKTITELSKEGVSIVLERKQQGPNQQQGPNNQSSANSGSPGPEQGTLVSVEGASGPDQGANQTAPVIGPQQQGTQQQGEINQPVAPVSTGAAENLGAAPQQGGPPGKGGKRTKRRRSKRVATKKK